MFVVTSKQGQFTLSKSSAIKHTYKTIVMPAGLHIHLLAIYDVQFIGLGS